MPCRNLLVVRSELVFRCVTVSLTFVARNTNVLSFVYKVKSDAASLEDGEIYQSDLTRLVDQGINTKRHTEYEWYDYTILWFSVRLRQSNQYLCCHSLKIPDVYVLSQLDTP